MSLYHSFCLWQFCSPLFGFFWLVPGFVESDQVLQRLLCVWVIVAEFETAAFDGFEQKFFCFAKALNSKLSAIC